MAEEKIRRPRGRQSPTHTLRDAVQFIEILAKKVGVGPVAREDICVGLGHSTNSGTASAKVGALTHFGLLEVVDKRRYEITELAQRIINPRNASERASAMVEAAKRPALYAELLAAFSGRELHELFHNTLIRDYQIIPKKAPEVAEIFRESMEFAGLLRQGRLYESLEGTDEATPVQSAEAQRQDAGPSAATAGASICAAPAPMDAGLRAYSFPLSRGQTCQLQIPTTVSKADIARIQAWIDLMQDVLTETAAGSTPAAEEKPRG